MVDQTGSHLQFKLDNEIRQLFDETKTGMIDSITPVLFEALRGGHLRVPFWIRVLLVRSLSGGRLRRSTNESSVTCGFSDEMAVLPLYCIGCFRTGVVPTLEYKHQG